MREEVLVSGFESFDDGPVPVEDAPVPADEDLLPLIQPRWARALAWMALVVGVIYLLNPTLGIDLLPDNLPIVGNLDEAAILLLILGATRYLGLGLPDFIERILAPLPRLPDSIEDDEDYE